MLHYHHLITIHTVPFMTYKSSLKRKLELNARNIRAIRRHGECQIPKLKVTGKSKELAVAPA